MSFGRWLLVHSFSLFMLALFILLYLFRSELQLDKAYQQLMSLEPIQVVAKAPPPQKTARMSKAKPTEPSSEPATRAAVKTNPSQTLVAVPTLGQASTDQASQTGDLRRARKAYWDNNYAQAIAEYQRLIQQYPNNPDYHGELGNIYYTLNNDQKAARLFYQAAVLFLQQGKTQHARSLVAPITALNRELGDRLRHQLQH